MLQRSRCRTRAGGFPCSIPQRAREQALGRLHYRTGREAREGALRASEAPGGVDGAGVGDLDEAVDQGAGATIAVVLADSGMKYLSTDLWS